MDDKTLRKIRKALGEDTMSELDNMKDDELKERIIKAQSSMREAKVELKKNEKYIQLKEKLKDMNGGLRDLNKRQQSIIDYVFYLLEGRGKI